MYRVTLARKNETSKDPGSPFFENSPESTLSCDMPARTEERAIEKTIDYWREQGYDLDGFEVKHPVIDLDD